MSRRRRPPAVRWTAPQLLLAAFAFVLATLYALSSWAPRGVAPPPALGGTEANGDLRQVEVRYVVVDTLGLERPGFADVDLSAAQAADPGARLTAALAALRDDLATAGLWPEELEAPAGYLFELDRRRLVVVDVPPLPPGASVDVAEELAVLRSLLATARVAAAAEEVRLTVGGDERPAMWGRVAPPRR